MEIDEVSRWTPSGDLTYLDIKIVPLAVDGQHLGVVITFVDVTRHRQLQQELEHAHRDLEVAYEELQSANEELETTNEGFSPPSRSWRRPTRSFSPPTRSWRP